MLDVFGRVNLSEAAIVDFPRLARGETVAPLPRLYGIMNGSQPGRALRVMVQHDVLFTVAVA